MQTNQMFARRVINVAGAHVWVFNKLKDSLRFDGTGSVPSTTRLGGEERTTGQSFVM